MGRACCRIAISGSARRRHQALPRSCMASICCWRVMSQRAVRCAIRNGQRLGARDASQVSPRSANSRRDGWGDYCDHPGHRGAIVFTSMDRGAHRPVGRAIRRCDAGSDDLRAWPRSAFGTPPKRVGRPPGFSAAPASPHPPALAWLRGVVGDGVPIGPRAGGA